jgi:hypothetical protein
MGMEGPDFSLDKAMPQCAAAIDAQIDCDDSRDDFKKEKPFKRPFIKELIDDQAVLLVNRQG